MDGMIELVFKTTPTLTVELPKAQLINDFAWFGSYLTGHPNIQTMDVIETASDLPPPATAEIVLATFMCIWVNDECPYGSDLKTAICEYFGYRKLHELIVKMHGDKLVISTYDTNYRPMIFHRVADSKSFIRYMKKIFVNFRITHVTHDFGKIDDYRIGLYGPQVIQRFMDKIIHDLPSITDNGFALFYLILMSQFKTSIDPSILYGIILKQCPKFIGIGMDPPKPEHRALLMRFDGRNMDTANIVFIYTKYFAELMLMSRHGFVTAAKIIFDDIIITYTHRPSLYIYMDIRDQINDIPKEKRPHLEVLEYLLLHSILTAYERDETIEGHDTEYVYRENMHTWLSNMFSPDFISNPVIVDELRSSQESLGKNKIISGMVDQIFTTI